MWQPRRSYRFGVEVYALAAFALDAPVARATDLGAGSGIIGLLLAKVGVRVTVVERDPRWVALLRRNVSESGLAVRVVDADIRTYAGQPDETGESPACDVVVCNPPWFSPTAGPISADSWRASSRTALHGGPGDFLRVGLGLAPRVCMVGPTLPAGPLHRRARLGRLWLGEYREDAGPVRDIVLDVPAAYARFGMVTPASTP